MDQLARFLIVKCCADRNLHNNRVAVQTAAVGAHAVLAALALVLRVVAEVDKRVVPLRADHDDVAAATAVAARRAAAGDKFLAPEGHAAIAAVAGFDANFCFIDKHCTTRDKGLRDQGDSKPICTSGAES